MNNLGPIIGHLTVVNSMENMEKMQENLQFDAAIAKVNHDEDTDKAMKEKDDDLSIEIGVPKVTEKLEKHGRNYSKLTVKEAEAILYRVYNIKMTGLKLRKANYVKAF